MQIKNVTYEDIVLALAYANVPAEGNLEFQQGFPAPLNQKHTRWAVKLRVKGYDQPGYRRGFPHGDRPGKRMPYACWHAHGWFMDGLPSTAVVRSGMRDAKPWSPGDEWQDVCVNEYLAIYISDCCDCENGG